MPPDLVMQGSKTMFKHLFTVSALSLYGANHPIGELGAL